MLQPIARNYELFEYLDLAGLSFCPWYQIGTLSGRVSTSVMLNYIDPHLHFRLGLILHEELVASFLDLHLVQ